SATTGLALAAVALLSSFAAAGRASNQPAASGPSAHVIVLARRAALPGLEVRTRKLGGTIERELGLVDGFSVRLPLGALAALRQQPGVISVTSDAHLHADGANYDPSSDEGSMDATSKALGAQSWWKAGYTGAGVDVALIDSGVSPGQGLRAPDKLVYGPDLSLESQAPNLTELDTFGHGTFVAGLIAGRDDAATEPYDDDAATVYRGIAPDARIVSVKVATAD